jgi:hypothetical protein
MARMRHQDALPIVDLWASIKGMKKEMKIISILMGAGTVRTLGSCKPYLSKE